MSTRVYIYPTQIYIGSNAVEYTLWLIVMDKYGKIDRCLFREIVYNMLGLMRDDVVYKPGFGRDFSVINIGEYDLVVSTDPFFILPEYGWYRAVWYALHTIAADVLVAGVEPRYLFLELNLPLEISDRDFVELWSCIHKVADKLRLAIAGGHIERYSGVEYPMLGSGMVIGVTKKGLWASIDDIRVGDEVLLVKGGGIETAATLAMLFPRVWIERYGLSFYRVVDNVFYMQSVYREAMLLSRYGLKTMVKYMHDATEHGVYGALLDIVEGTRYGVYVYYDRLFIDKGVDKILELYMRFSGVRIDPYWVTSEGTLVVVVRRGVGEEIASYLNENGVRASVIGYIDGSGKLLVEKNGVVEETVFPEQNYFYKLFHSVLESYRKRYKGSRLYTEFKSPG